MRIEHDSVYYVVPVLIVLALGWLTLTFVATIIHEAGHYTFAKVAGVRVTSFGCGFGRPYLRVRFGGTIFFLARDRSLQGITFLDPGLLESKVRTVIGLAGGITCNAAVATGLAMILSTVPVSLWSLCGWVFVGLNAYFAIANLIPFPYRAGPVVYHSDGAQILGILLGGPPRRDTSDTLNSLTALLPLWDAIGDGIQAKAARYHLAYVWASLENRDRTEMYFAEAESTRAQATDRSRASAALARLAIATLHDRYDDALVAADEICDQVVGDVKSHALWELNRAEVRVYRNDLDAARAAFDSPVVRAGSNDPDVIKNRDLVDIRIAIAASHPADPGIVDRLLRTLRDRTCDPAFAATGYRLLAILAESLGNATEAEEHTRQGLESVTRLSRHLVNPEDRSAMLPFWVGCGGDPDRFDPGKVGGRTAHLTATERKAASKDRTKFRIGVIQLVGYGFVAMIAGGAGYAIATSVSLPLKRIGFGAMTFSGVYGTLSLLSLFAAQYWHVRYGRSRTPGRTDGARVLALGCISIVTATVCGVLVWLVHPG